LQAEGAESVVAIGRRDEGAERFWAFRGWDEREIKSRGVMDEIHKTAVEIDW